MQHIIGIIYDKCRDYIDAYFATHPPVCCSVDRGDPGAADFYTGDFVTDNTWQDLDLSAIVPAGTCLVSFHIKYKCSIWSNPVRFRKRGNVNFYNSPIAGTISPVGFHWESFTVSCDADRFIQYQIPSAPDWFIELTVAGWFIGGDILAGFHNRGDPAAYDFTESDFPAYQVWTDLDLTSIIPANTSVVLLRCRVRSTNNQRSLRFRTKGHSNSINISHCEAVQAGLYYYYDIEVPTNGLQTIQYWSSLGLLPVAQVTVKGWWC